MRNTRLVMWFLLGSAIGGCRHGANDQSHQTSINDQKSVVSSEIDPTTESSESINSPLSEQLELNEPADSIPAIAFRWVNDSGISFRRNDDMRGQQRIFESTGGGVGVIDYDRDGKFDLFFTGGCKLPEEFASKEPTCGFFRHTGNVKFFDVTRHSGLIKGGFCQGVAVGDYDNDGFDDLYVTALGNNALFHNQGDGHFTDVTELKGVNDPRWSTSCAFADLNLDGSLDLYVVNYLAESVTSPLLCKNPASPSGLEQCPPSKFEGVNDRVFLGDGLGGFVDVTIATGLHEKLGKGLGVVVADFDNHGLPEIFVSNDGQANFLFRLSIGDDQSLKFEEIGLGSGVALSRSGYAQASMGIAAGDFDKDGLIDLHITNFYGDSNTLYKNQGSLGFEDITRSTGLAGPSRSVLGWGTVFVDFDHDGWLDLFVANGHVEDRTWNGRGEPFEMLAQVFRNLGNGKFEDASNSAGEYFNSPLLGRGVSVVDLNGDGGTDLVVSQQLAVPSILINDRPDASAVVLRLVGTLSNRNGFGAKLEIFGSDSKPPRRVELMPGTSYQSSHSLDVIVSGEKESRVQVTWPSGVKQQIELTAQDSKNVREFVIVEPQSTLK
jgi:enediyne biosynthesis protein E4